MFEQKLDLENAFAAYTQAKQLGLELHAVVYTTLLCLAAGLGEQGSGNMTVRLTEPPQDIDKALVVFEDMRALERAQKDKAQAQRQKALDETQARETALRGPADHEEVQQDQASASQADEPSRLFTESAFTAVIRCCAQNDRPAEALALYADMNARQIEPRIRSISALLALLAKHGDQVNCESIFSRLTDHLRPTEKEYASMLVLYKGTERFVEYLERMADDFLELSYPETLQVIREHFAEQTIAMASISKTGIVDANGEQLLSIDLEDSTRERLLSQLDAFAINRDPNHKFKPNNKIKEFTKPSAPATGDEQKVKDAAKDARIAAQRTVIWEEYKTFLSHKHSQGGFDLIIDGANIGYYKQNYPGAPSHVCYEQIDHMLTMLEDQGHKPLLILHSRHLGKDMVPSNMQGLVDKWLSKGVLYATPKQFNDDWFWMYAAVKYKCRVVTNDDMRDHHFLLFFPKYFLQWRERYRVTYEMFSHFGSEAKEGGSSICYGSRTISMYVRWPRVYSHRIQHVVSEQWDGWYFPPLVPPPLATPQQPVSAAVGDEAKEGEQDGEKEAVEEGKEAAPVSKQWLCVYRHVDRADGAGVGGKRKRDVDEVLEK